MALALSTKPWGSIAEADYADASDFCSGCLIDLNPPGAEKARGLCKLPIREPRSMGGMFNRSAMAAAAAALAGARGGVQASSEEKRTAAKKLLSRYRQAQLPPPAGLEALAR